MRRLICAVMILAMAAPAGAQAANRLYYRAELQFEGKSTWSLPHLSGGLRIAAGTMNWRLESDNAFLVKRVCTQPPRPSRPASTAPGRCSGRGIEDVRFLNAAVGELSHFGFAETYPYEDRFGGDGRIRDCGQATALYTLANPGQEIEGFIRTAAGSQGVAYGWDLSPTVGDAIAREPADEIHCTTESPDGMGGWMNPRPYTVPADAPDPAYLHDVRGLDAAYARGTEHSGTLDLRFPLRRFGNRVTETFKAHLEVEVAAGAPPLILDDELRLTLEPCPGHGVNVQAC